MRVSVSNPYNPKEPEWVGHVIGWIGVKAEEEAYAMAIILKEDGTFTEVWSGRLKFLSGNYA